MAGSTIISVTKLQNRLPTGAKNTNNQITDAVNMATTFVNGWAEHYDPFDEFSVSPDTVNAPANIESICLEVGEAFYFRNIAQIDRNGEEMTFWNDVLNTNKETLKEINIEPEWIEQTIILDSNDAMIIGDRNGGGDFPRVIPQKAQIITTGKAVFIRFDDWDIRRGGVYTDQYPDAWYLYAETTAMNGHILRYMRTFRNDSIDYARYNKD